MRSIFVFIKKSDREQVIACLNSICTKRNGSTDAWITETNGDPVLYVEFSENSFQNEIGANEWNDLVSKLGEEPKMSISVDISGRHDGKNEVMNFLASFLEINEGYVMDDYTDYAWSLNEIRNSVLVEGLPFFDYTGWPIKGGK